MPCDITYSTEGCSQDCGHLSKKARKRAIRERQRTREKISCTPPICVDARRAQMPTDEFDFLVDWFTPKNTKKNAGLGFQTPDGSGNSRGCFIPSLASTQLSIRGAGARRARVWRNDLNLFQTFRPSAHGACVDNSHVFRREISLNAYICCIAIHYWCEVRVSTCTLGVSNLPPPRVSSISFTSALKSTFLVSERGRVLFLRFATRRVWRAYFNLVFWRERILPAKQSPPPARKLACCLAPWFTSAAAAVQ